MAAGFEKELTDNLTKKDLLQLPYWKILVLQFCQHIRSF